MDALPAALIWAKTSSGFGLFFSFGLLVTAVFYATRRIAAQEPSPAATPESAGAAKGDAGTDKQLELTYFCVSFAFGGAFFFWLLAGAAMLMLTRRGW